MKSHAEIQSRKASLAAEWRKVRLGDCYEVHNGLSKARDCFGSGFPFLSYSVVFNNFFLPAELPNLAQTTEEEQESYSIKEGDVFITRTSETSDELGMSSVALKNYPKATYNGFCKRLRPISNEVNPRFIGYYLRTAEFRAKFDGIGASMITRASLRNEDLLSMKISLPPLPIQQRIAEILGAYDDLIENNRRRIALLEKMSRELYRERFVRRADERRQVALGEIAQFARGKVITKNDARPGEVPVIAGGLEPAYYHNIANTTAPVVTVSGSGANSGYTSIHFRDVWVSDCSWVDANSCKYPLFAYCFLKENEVVLRNLQQGAAQPHVYPKDINALEVYLPDCDALIEFEALVAPLFKEQANLLAQNRSLARQRDALLPRLMSGKIDFKELEKEVP